MMGDITANAQELWKPCEEQEKLKVLIRDFGKLGESQKDYIRELTRKLADIHGKAAGGDTGQG